MGRMDEAVDLTKCPLSPDVISTGRCWVRQVEPTTSKAMLIDHNQKQLTSVWSAATPLSKLARKVSRWWNCEGGIGEQVLSPQTPQDAMPTTTSKLHESTALLPTSAVRFNLYDRSDAETGMNEFHQPDRGVIPPPALGDGRGT